MDTGEWMRQQEIDLWREIVESFEQGDFTMTQATTPRVTGNLDLKLVAAHLKQAHKEHPIMVQRCGDDFNIATGFMMVKVPAYADIPFIHNVDETWERFTFSAKEQDAHEGGPDQQDLWSRTIKTELVERLEMTDWIREITSSVRGKTGQLARKLVAAGERTVLIDKKICDMLNPDADELNGFLFEQASADGPVRVACRYGYVAILMPMQINR